MPILCAIDVDNQVETTGDDELFGEVGQRRNTIKFSLVGIDLLDVEMRKLEEEEESQVFLIEGEQNIPPYML